MMHAGPRWQSEAERLAGAGYTVNVAGNPARLLCIDNQPHEAL